VGPWQRVEVRPHDADAQTCRLQGREALTGIGALIFPWQAGGEIISRDGKPVGSALIGQNFASDRYFQPRPSATNTPDPKDATKTIDAPYNAANSGASNLGPSSKALIDRGQGRRRRETQGRLDRPDSRRRPDHVRLRPRPAYIAGKRSAPGAGRRQGARPRRRKSARSGAGASGKTDTWSN
jgi:hypothetical protein